MSGIQTPGSDETQKRVGERSVKLYMESFAWQAIEQQSEALGVSVEDFIVFSALYYLADLDSGRVARQIARSPYPESS